MAELTARHSRRIVHAMERPLDDTAPAEMPRSVALVAGQLRALSGVLALTLAGWAFLAWLVFDMGHPIAQLTMPESMAWGVASTLAIFAMWAVMMAAMMLPSALPMILTLAHLAERNRTPAAGRSFVAAYLLVWLAFSAAATAFQWVLQAMDWVDSMIVSSSAPLNAVLLAIAGIYQFSPLKRSCLAACRTPVGFLMGEWRPGTRGAFVMGLRHGLFCLGCCWALMVLLFVGGVMNLAWIAALAVLVAIEKMAPKGEWIALALGGVLLAVGVGRAVGLAG